MLQLLDGPCQGDIMVKRAPVFLRAVLGPRGKIDVLDQLDDTPAADEKVFVYRREGDSNQMHIYARGKGGKALTGWWPFANYKHLPDVDGEQLRDNAKWQAYVTQQYGGTK